MDSRSPLFESIPKRKTRSQMLSYYTPGNCAFVLIFYAHLPPLGGDVLNRVMVAPQARAPNVVSRGRQG